MTNDQDPYAGLYNASTTIPTANGGQEQDPYASLYNNGKGDLAPTQQKPSGNGAFMSLVDNMNYQFSKFPSGVINQVGKGLSALGFETGDKIQKAVAYDQAKQKAEAEADAVNHPIASGIGTGIGLVGDAVYKTAMTPGQNASSLLGKVGVGAAAGSGFGYLDYAESEEANKNNALVGGVLGGAVPLAFKVFSSFFKSNEGMSGIISKINNPTKSAEKDISTLVSQTTSPEELASKVSNVRNKLGATLAPEDVIDNPMLGNYVKSVESSPGVQKSALDYIKAKGTVLGRNIDDLTNQVLPQGRVAAKAERDAMYNQLKQVNISDDALDALKQNPTIQTGMTTLANSIDTQVGDLPMNNAFKLDVLKQDLQQALYSGQRRIGKSNETISLTNDEKGSIKNAIGSITDAIDEATDGVYSQKMLPLAQQIINHGKVTKELGTIDKKTTTYVQQAYNKLWADPAKQQDFLGMIQKAGGDVNAAQQTIAVIKQAVGAQKTGRASITGVQSLLNQSLKAGVGSSLKVSWQDKLVNLLTGQYQEQLIKTMTRPDWPEKVAAILKQSSPEKKVKFLLDYITPSEAQAGLGIAIGAGRLGESE